MWECGMIRRMKEGKGDEKLPSREATRLLKVKGEDANRRNGWKMDEKEGERVWMDAWMNVVLAPILPATKQHSLLLHTAAVGKRK